MLVLNLPFKALMFLTLMRPSLVLFLVLWLKLVKDFLKVRCRLALLPFLISCLIWLDLVASLPLIKERILVIILLLHFLSLMLGSVLVLMLPLLVWLTPDLRIKKSLLKCNWTIAHNDKSVHGVLNPTYQAGLRRDAVQPDIEAERKKRDEIEAGKSYCSRRFGGATCDDKSAQIYARFDKNDWRIQPAEFYRFHDAEVNTFGYF